MTATVRWVENTRFGIETDEPIETARLRTAQADQLVTADSKADFQIVPAPRLSTWRPGLGLTPDLPGSYGSRRSEEHTSELQSLMRISYAVFCLNKKNRHKMTTQ